MVSENEWDAYEDYILKNIGVLIYPKKLNKISGDTAIFNSDNQPIIMQDPQYFIDLPVEGHILGILWVLTFGIELDHNCDDSHPNGMYEHSYGNRLRKTLVNKQTGDVT